MLAYLSRYTHRVAISNRRLLAADERSVTFAYKDYADAARPKTMTLDTSEFVRRFGLHVLPERFVKIRHYGLLGNRQRAHRLAQARQCLGTAPTPESEKPTAVAREPQLDGRGERCPFCHQPALILVREVAPGHSTITGIFDSS